MEKNKITRRRFIGTSAVAAIGSSAFGLKLFGCNSRDLKLGKDIVSIARVKDGNIAKAVEEAIDLLGGMQEVTEGKNRIMLKPNLVTSSADCTTKPVVISTLARLMQKAGKEVMIGEGSAAVYNFNANDHEVFRTKKREVLDSMQQFVFDNLGYSEMARSLNIPLVNLHSGDMVEVPLKNGLVANSVKIHRSLSEADLLCSVPMMKTHSLATVTLAMKNLIGLYPGTEYYSLRAWLHDRAVEAGSPGIAYEILDMNNAVKTGLSVIDASTAMEGNGPTDGSLVDMGLIIAGTSPLATDMVGASLMGFEMDEIPAIVLAHDMGILPSAVNDIEIRGLKISQCKRNFIKPGIVNWDDINESYGVKEI